MNLGWLLRRHFEAFLRLFSGLHTAPALLLWKPLMGIVHTATALSDGSKYGLALCLRVSFLSRSDPCRRVSVIPPHTDEVWRGRLLTESRGDFPCLLSGIHTSLNICCLRLPSVSHLGFILGKKTIKLMMATGDEWDGDDTDDTWRANPRVANQSNDYDG